MASTQGSAFAYHEPSIKTVLNYTGFLLTLNIVNTCLDQLLYCGLIGQLFIGVLWGTPGAQWFDQETERVIQQIGYLGLILLIYEGGLSTSIKSLKANILLSTAVAITGICVPMGLSFILKEIVSATSLQSFAAGAALSATSLGTTFTILSTTQLTTTRLGTVTTSAAMLDDVVGLVMIQIISNLGGTNSFSPVTVIRPVFVSIGFAVGLLLLCAFCLQPTLKKLLGYKDKFPAFVGTAQFAFLAQTCVLVGIMAGATYAGTSSLFAAYLAGVVVSWFDGLVAETKIPITDLQSGDSHDQTLNHQGSTGNSKNGCTEETPSPPVPARQTEITHKLPTGEFIYSKYYKAPVNRILLPFFFASIGFAIPITKMFSGQVVWRGIIYAMLMAIGKMLTGLWLVRFSPSPVSGLVSTIKKLFACVHSCATPWTISGKPNQNKKTTQIPAIQDDSAYVSTPNNVENESWPMNRSPAPNSRPSSRISLPPKPKSLYPPAILGLAMVARGEVGYLIASIAESKGMFSNESSEGPSETYLVVIWAISLCTLIGPILVGTLVRRVKKLQQSREDMRSDPLGVWRI
ncbi:Cation/H+ exchanger [Penicillium griseofulvum]|uniref:Cation/H+ exchanger n=1 Tax=Penicillium patulum TaxID=5078 RepID=A0A135LY54_PENPA|nr:Cation/H+ exchanger [Penicillium griseofulvum]KXG53883.1 Cation/H+ exchanger [Penicillium griseofulvum]